MSPYMVYSPRYSGEYEKECWTKTDVFAVYSPRYSGEYEKLHAQTVKDFLFTPRDIPGRMRR